MRTSGVKLIADVGNYIRGVRGAADETDKLTKSIDGTGKSSKVTGLSVDDLGGDLRDTGRDARALKSEIEKVERSLAGLAVEFAATSSAADRLDLTKSIRRQQGELRQLLKVQRLLPTAAEVEPAAVGFGARLSAGIGKGIEAAPMSAPVLAALGGAGIAAAPLIGAAVAGAIIGGAGIGGVVGGLTLAAKDTRVKAAANELGDRLEQRLYRAGGAFVTPTLAGLLKVETALNGIDIEGILGDSAQLVQPLAAGVSSLVTDLGGALRELIANAGPPVRAIADGIAEIGSAAAKGLKSLADNGEEGAAALRTIFDLISSGISVTFTLVNALTELYGISRKFGLDTGLQLLLKATSHEMDNTAESARKTGSGTFGMSQNFIKAAESADELKKRQGVLKAAQDAVAASQDRLQQTLDTLGGKSGFATRAADALSQAMDNLYGATIRQADANEAYEASWDSLSGAIKGNSRSLNIHTDAGRQNRGVLKGLIGATNDAYIADVNAGVAIDSARAKHDKRIKSIERESVKLGLNREKTRDLIRTYGQIPPDKTTDLVLDGVRGVVGELKKLYTLQRAMALGININMVTGTGTVKNFKAAGGPIDGPGTGTSDSVPIMASAGEHMWTAAEVQAAGGHDAMYAMRKDVLNSPQGYARGGAILTPVDTSHRWPFKVNAANTHVMSRAEALSKVTPAVPSGGRTSDWIVATVRARFPGIDVLSKDRPGARTLSGNVSYHARGRAVDFEPSKALAAWWDATYRSRTKELISPYQQYNIHNGRRHRYTGAVWNQHNFAGGNAHDHIAMDDGGMRVLQPGLNVIANGTGRPEPIAGPTAMASMAGSTTVITVAPTFHINGANASPQQIAAQVNRQLGAQFDQLARGITR